MTKPEARWLATLLSLRLAEQYDLGIPVPLEDTSLEEEAAAGNRRRLISPDHQQLGA
jgi:hypothetical protein